MKYVSSNWDNSLRYVLLDEKSLQFLFPMFFQTRRTLVHFPNVLNLYNIENEKLSLEDLIEKGR